MKNTRFYEAVIALSTSEGGAKDRCVLAMQILEKMHPSELDLYPKLKIRLNKLQNELGQKERYQSGSLYLDRYENTAKGRLNRTYVKYAREIFSIWLELEEI